MHSGPGYTIAYVWHLNVVKVKKKPLLNREANTLGTLWPSAALSVVYAHNTPVLNDLLVSVHCLTSPSCLESLISQLLTFLVVLGHRNKYNGVKYVTLGILI